MPIGKASVLRCCSSSSSILEVMLYSNRTLKIKRPKVFPKHRCLFSLIVTKNLERTGRLYLQRMLFMQFIFTVSRRLILLPTLPTLWWPASNFCILQVPRLAKHLFYFAATKDFLRCLLMLNCEKMSLPHSVIAFTMTSMKASTNHQAIFQRSNWFIQSTIDIISNKQLFVNSLFSTNLMSIFKDQCNSDLCFHLSLLRSYYNKFCKIR